MVLTVHIRHESLLMASCICSSPENKIPYTVEHLSCTASAYQLTQVLEYSNATTVL